MLKPLPEFILRKLFRKKVTLKKYSKTGTDDAYGQKEDQLIGTYVIEAEIQEITAYDLAYVVPGILQVGDAMGYFLPQYFVDGRYITVEVEDRVTWNNKTWRVEKIEDFYYGDKLMHKRALLKRVV